MTIEQGVPRAIIGGVDSHKDRHVAAIVDAQDRVIASESFATTRQVQSVDVERSFGELPRAGIEAAGTYGAGVLRYFQKSGIKLFEVTGPDKQARGTSDRLDAEAAAHAAFAGKRPFTPNTRNGLIEALRVLNSVLTKCR